MKDRTKHCLKTLVRNLLWLVGFVLAFILLVVAVLFAKAVVGPRAAIIGLYSVAAIGFVLWVTYVQCREGW